MMTSLLSNWPITRLLRAGLAIWAFAEVYRTGDWLLFGIGAILALQAAFNVGCCGAAGCASPPARQQKQAGPEEISYEEVR